MLCETLVRNPDPGHGEETYGVLNDGEDGNVFKSGLQKRLRGCLRRQPLPDISSSAYKAGGRARKHFADLMTKAGFVERDGNWFPEDDLRDDS